MQEKEASEPQQKSSQEGNFAQKRTQTQKVVTKTVVDGENSQIIARSQQSMSQKHNSGAKHQIARINKSEVDRDAVRDLIVKAMKNRDK